MQIQLENTENNSIEGYTETSIKIHSEIYEKSLIVSRERLIPDLKIRSIREMNFAFLEEIKALEHEIIIVGHQQNNLFPDLELIAALSKQGIALEQMSIGAACRTYNILINEFRAVTALFIFA